MGDSNVPQPGETDENKTEENRVRRKSFTDALKEKYSIEHISNNRDIVVRFHAQFKDNRSKAELAHLKCVGLNDFSIANAGLPQDGLVSLCPNINDLDLSNNLIDSWEVILLIMAQLPNLKFLNLTKNKLTNNKDTLSSWQQPLQSVENLVLNDTGVTWKEVASVSRHMPRLKELHVCCNEYSDLHDDDLDGLESVECLRLNQNNITSWREVWKLRKLPKLKTLILSQNPLQDVFYAEDDDSVAYKKHIAAECLKIIDDISLSSSMNFEHVDNNDDVEHICVVDPSDIKLNAACKTCECDNVFQSDEKMLVKDSCETMLSNSENFHHNTQTLSSADNGAKDDGMDDNDLQDSGIGICQAKQNESTETNGNASASTKVLTSEMNNNDSNNCQKNKKQIEETHLQAANGDSGKASSIKAFPSLETLCISQTMIDNWSHLQAVNEFPNLQSVRIMDINLLSDMNKEEKRKLFIACLPRIKQLNGGEISITEREKAEWSFLRHFMDKETKPFVYDSLEAKYGRPKPLVDIYIHRGFQEWVTLNFIRHEELVLQDKVRTVQSIKKLRTFIAEKLSLTHQSFRMYHHGCGPNHDPRERPTVDELFLDNLPMSRFDFMDFDEIIITDMDGYQRKMFYNVEHNL